MPQQYITNNIFILQFRHSFDKEAYYLAGHFYIETIIKSSQNFIQILHLCAQQNFKCLHCNTIMQRKYVNYSENIITFMCSAKHSMCTCALPFCRENQNVLIILKTI